MMGLVAGLIFVVGGVGGVGMTVENIEVGVELEVVLRQNLHSFRVVCLFVFIFVIGGGGVRVGC